MLYQSSHYKYQVSLRSGFGLIELMVSISIMALIMGVIYARQDGFNSTVLLRSQAYEVALQIREVQLNAVSASTIQGSSRTVLGLLFTTDTPNSYQIFRDANTPPNAQIDGGELFGPQGVIDRRFEIDEIRIDGTSIGNDSLTLMFERPNFDALIFRNGTLQTTANEVEIDVARVGATGTGPEDVRTVTISSSGQISVVSNIDTTP